MRFGKTLRQSIYPPWKEQYIDYSKLKRLLRDDEDEGSDADGEAGGWTEDDENRFCEEVFNVQLEKVAGFQEARANELRDRADAIFEKLRKLTPANGEDDEAEAEAEVEVEVEASETPSKPSSKGKEKSEITVQRVREIETELDSITNELRELKRYSSLNYTGFLKIVKKHDRKRGNHYRIRPMMQVSLVRRPFNSEAGYLSLLAKLSLMFAAVHQYLDPDDLDATAASAAAADFDILPGNRSGGRYVAHKFWVHPDNLLEVKTMVLRHLPALIYSDSSSKDADATADPTLTSLYFDNEKFSLYNNKLERSGETATSLRLRWYGQLAAKPELFLDEKVAHKDGTSEEHRITIKDKYVKPFLDGNYKMEKSIQKMERQGERAEVIDAFRQTADAIQAEVREKSLEPMLRANYVRTAFQKPADDRVRVSIDTNLAFVREDTLDRRRPCRDAAEWHRRDVDTANGSIAYPFSELPSSDVSCFPYAILEIKVRDDFAPFAVSAAASAASATASGADSNTAPAAAAVPVTRKRIPPWVEDLMTSHLVHPAPHFSKFVHGIAILFDDYVNRLPFWLSDLERDIRRDPQEVFAEEEQRRAQRAADEQVVGSFLGTSRKGSSGRLGSSSYQGAGAASVPGAASKSTSRGKSVSLADRLAAESSLSQRIVQQHREQQSQASGGSHGAENGSGSGGGWPSYGTISSVLPAFSMSRYAKWRRALVDRSQQEGSHGLELPEGVTEPTEWLKNAGPLRIEPKVWLANERTFLKWQHISILLGGLAVALFTAGSSDSSGKDSNNLAVAMGIAYTVVAAFAGFWGWYMLQTRREMIVARSGRDFDNMVGPVAVSVALVVALILNLTFAYRSALRKWDAAGSYASLNSSHELLRT